MINSFIDTLPILTILAIVFLLFLAAGATGAALRRRLDTMTESFYATSAAISLLALLIGFTFAVVLNRYDARRDLLIEETAAITMLWQRVELLANPERDEMSSIVRQYVDERLRYFESNVTVDRRRAADKAGDILQDRMWEYAREMNETNKRPIMTRALIDALTRVDDASWKREAASREHIPLLVIDLLILFSAITTAIIGYTTAAHRRVNQIPNIALIALLTLTIGMVIDLDRPRSGLVQVSQQSMIELRTDLAEDSVARAKQLAQDAK